MHRILIFGGTTEGRLLAEFCAEQGLSVSVCVATPYGEELLFKSERLHVHTGRLSPEAMAELIRTEGPELVVDATHPYAREASGNIRRACAETGARLFRIIREQSREASGEYFDTLPKLIEALNELDGNVLATTGSRDAAAYLGVREYQRRIWLRVLNDTGVINECVRLGFPREHIISGRGPFSEEENIAHLRRAEAAVLTTKDSGRAGGFFEKLSAAEKCGAGVLILRRPVEDGISADRLRELIVQEFLYE